MIRRFRFLGKRYETAQVLVAALLLIPILTSLILFFVVPVINLVSMSFTNFSMTTVNTKNVGLDNYKYVLGDAKFGKAMWNTVVFSVVKLSLDAILAMMIALALDANLPIRRFFRIAYFAPVVVPVSACALIWIWFYDPGIGPLNQLLGLFGLPPSQWLYHQSTALLSVIIFSVWKGLGYNVVLLLAGLQNIPDSYLEAARIDGATAWQGFWRIKLPLLSPTVSFVIMMGIINSFKMFTEINILTPDGGPLQSTLLTVVYIYQQSFTNGKMARGAAAAIILFFIILLLTLFQKAVSKKTVFYE